MSNGPVVRRVLFHANAVALAANIQNPKQYFVEAVACSGLPVTGGYAEAHSNGDKKGIFSYDSAFTSVLGEFVPREAAASLDLKGRNYDDNDLPAQTILKATLKGLKIEASAGEAGSPRRTVKVDQLDAEIRSFYDRKNPIEFRMLQVTVDGVSVDGKKLIVDTNTQVFTENNTLAKLVSALKDDTVRQRSASQIFYNDDEVMLGTIVSGLRWADGVPQGVTPGPAPGNTLAIPGLGTLYFGEIYIEQGLRRLTLLRTQLGSPDGGSGAFVDCISNNQTIPP
jgi:hypothetical protein